MSFTVKGSYFALAEFLYNIETLPRVAKVQIHAGQRLGHDRNLGIHLRPVSTLQMTGTVNFYTTDTERRSRLPARAHHRHVVVHHDRRLTRCRSHRAIDAPS